MPPNLRPRKGRTSVVSPVRLEVHEDDSATTALLKKTGQRALLLWDELPEWQKDNEHIHSGFRPETNSCWESIKSMGYIHNQTGNIYSHLFAALWMIGLGIWWSGYADARYPQTGADDAIVFFLFFLGGTICFLLSTTYHVLGNHSHATSTFCLKLDFLGILTVTAGCFPPGLWFTFPCMSRQTKFTFIAIDLVAQFCAAMLALFSKTFQSSEMRALRGLVFSIMASSAFYPIIAKIFQIGFSRADAEYGASLYGLTILIYLSSVTTYAFRFTEAWRPGAFDIWGHSHQIFHVGMAIGLTVHFMAFVQAMDQFYLVKGGQCPD